MARTKTLTKANLSEQQKLTDALRAARAVIYAASPSTETRLSECLKLATNVQRLAYKDALDALHIFEHRMIAEGRGYRNAGGIFYPYF